MTVNKRTKRLTPIYELQAGSGLPPSGRQHIHETPLLEKLPDEELDLLKLRPRDLRRLDRLTTMSSDSELLDAVTTVATDEEHADFILSLLIALKEQAPEQAVALVRKFRGDAVLVQDDPALLGEALHADENVDDVVNLRDLSEEELGHLLSGEEFDDWMLYLHPDQRRIVDERFPGPALLRGVSGSGKTCVIVHRAKVLAERYGSGRVGVFTLNSALAELIGHLADRLCTSTIRARIDVLGMDELCRRIVRHYEPTHQLQVHDPRSDELLEDSWVDSFGRAEQQELLGPIIRSLRETYGLDPQRYVRDEFIWVRSAFRGVREGAEGFWGREAYLDPARSRRHGRSVTFSKNWRERVLSALEFYEEWLRAGEFVDHAELSLLAQRYVPELRRGTHPFRYRSILVDEDQDLGAVELQILAAMCDQQEDSLFFAGDMSQQVYPKYHSFRAAGIELAKQRYFRKNYRNTREILEAATGVLARHGNLQGGAQGLERSLDPIYSARHSAKPLVVACKSELQELAYVQFHISQMWTIQNTPAPVCIVVCGYREDDERALRAIQASYKQHGLTVELLQRDSRIKPRTVYLSALETVKGFEFPLVLITRCMDRYLPNPTLPEGEAWRDARRLYVAMTRARDELVLTHAGRVSSLIGDGQESFLWRSAADEMPPPPEAEAPEPLVQATLEARRPSDYAADGKTLKGRCRFCGRPAMPGDWSCAVCAA